MNTEQAPRLLTVTAISAHSVHLSSVYFHGEAENVNAAYADQLRRKFPDIYIGAPDLAAVPIVDAYIQPGISDVRHHSGQVMRMFLWNDDNRLRGLIVCLDDAEAMADAQAKYDRKQSYL